VRESSSQKSFDDYQGWLATEAGTLASSEQKAETLMKIFDGYKIQFFDIDGQQAVSLLRKSRHSVDHPALSADL
jgi:hypothetical protein